VSASVENTLVVGIRVAVLVGEGEAVAVLVADGVDEL